MKHTHTWQLVDLDEPNETNQTVLFWDIVPLQKIIKLYINIF